MLGVRPLLGRLFLPEEYHVDEGYILLSYDFWQREFGGDPNIVGRTIAENHPMKVVGVMPRLPDFFPQTDVWATLIPDFEFMRWRGNRFLRVFGRLKHGVSPAQAEQELTAILRRRPENPPNLGVTLSPLRDDLVGSRVRPILILLMSAVGMAPALALIREHRAVAVSGSRATQAMRRPRRNLLVVSEVGLSLILIIGAGLLLRSLRNLVREDLGFAPDHLLLTYMRLPNGDPTVAGFYQRLLDELPQLPGVQAAAVADCVAGTESAYSANLRFPDRAADPAHIPTASGCWISADYVRATGTAVLRGRSFTTHANRDAHAASVVNQFCAPQY